MSASKKQKTETAALDLVVNTKLFTVATCNLNQWAMDFTGNLRRIEESIRVAKARGARYRCGPELEVSGYGCEDHFHEGDTILHCWQSLASLLAGDLTDGILCDIGMPIIHKNVRYNCRVFLLDRKMLHIRPKICMADDGNYRETRWFTEWNAVRCAALRPASLSSAAPRRLPQRASADRRGCSPASQGRGLEEYALPGMIAAITGQKTVPIGVAAIAVADTVVGSETCEEVFTPNSPHIALALDGVEIISNGSGSHHSLRKLDYRLELLRSATNKVGAPHQRQPHPGCPLLSFAAPPACFSPPPRAAASTSTPTSGAATGAGCTTTDVRASSSTERCSPKAPSSACTTSRCRPPRSRLPRPLPLPCTYALQHSFSSHPHG